MDEIGRSYLTLALNIDRHFEGVVDAYFGPPELKAEVEAVGPRAMDALADDARQLQAAIDASDYDLQRKDYLKRQTRAMAAVIRNLAGDELDFMEEVELYFDIRPEMVDEAVFEEIHADIDRLLPGGGSLFERLEAWRKSMELEPDRIIPVFELVLEESRARTLALFDLPAGEEVSLQLVDREPWSAYNWYLGDYRSRIDVNTDLPVKAYQAVPAVTHEAYPGHHTEHAIKEHRRYQREGRAEHAIVLALAPESLISEGIAESGAAVIFTEAELSAFLREELWALAGLRDAYVQQQMGVARALDALRQVPCNGALFLHGEGRAPDEVQKYVENYMIRSPHEAAKLMQFIESPLWRSYAFNYTVGRDLLTPLLEGPDGVANFARLLSEPFTPSQVRRWVAERQEAGPR